ncbi:MAG TPA: 4-alpha-glucanotransferase [Candidatus Nanopelagicales bacterium]|nr:4-alpha-glucanotransferase [Candidatus Nanopelagicales bacterium]
MNNDLVALASAYGVATEFWDQAGAHQEVSEETVVAVLAALGVDATSPESVAAALAERRIRDWRRTLPPVFVVREGDGATCWVHLPHGDGARMWIELEDGGSRSDVVQVDRWVEPVDVDGVLVGEATFALPGDLPTGWHRLHVEVTSTEFASEHSSTVLVVTPRALALPERLRGRRGWGFAAQLYSVRSARSWGLGDVSDLEDLVSWSGRELGADFVLVNPLHAASPVPPMAPSPYLPVTRRFANPIYLRVEAVPEYAYLSEEHRAQVEVLAKTVRPANTSAALLERDPVWMAKRVALELVSKVPRSLGRQAAYDDFVEREGVGLDDFALWCALSDQYGEPALWPEELADPHGPAAEKARADLTEPVEFHRWCQWVLDEQLAQAQASASDSGMAIGVMHDLAVGVHPEGADAWALRDVLAKDVAVGAPPDMYNQMGQDWSQPPWRPDALAEAAFIPYRDMLRTVLRHAGGIRVDHVLGLFRLWWIPRGMPANAGTYVRYDHDALVGILALEAQRAGAVVIGEDLGTVEAWVQDTLRDRGILGTSILWFEKDDADLPLAPEHWRELALASVTTHDLPPTAGFLAGEHVRLRDELGLLATSYDEELAAHESDLEAWLTALRERGLLREHATEADIVEALHRYVARTPARLIAVSLADAVGDRRAQNQPGTDQEYPNWRVPLCDGAGEPVLLEDLPGSAFLRRLVAAVRS